MIIHELCKCLVDVNKGEGSDTKFNFQAQVDFEEGEKGEIANELPGKLCIVKISI